MYNDYLYHYGVKGMRWGVRRTAAQLGHLVKKVGSTTKTAIKNQIERRKPVSSMSDEDLRKRLERIRMEMQYKQAVESLNSKKESPVKKLLSDFGNNTVSSISRKLTDKIIKAIFPEPEKKIKTFDPDNIDQTNPEEVAAANRHFVNLNNLKKNIEIYNQNYYEAIHDPIYKARVESGKGEIQEALKRMEKRNK